MEAAQRIVAMIRESIRGDKKVRYEDFVDIIAEAERTGDRKALIQEYTRRRAAVQPPDYSGMSEGERAVEAERRRSKALAEADCPEERARARILDFDPKQRGEYYNRVELLIENFDIDDESPLGPMRFTNRVYQGEHDYIICLCHAINIFDIKIASSDVGFPIQMYGTVLARDSVDHKCVYLFRCDRDHPQLINYKNQSLILTGPKRGLALMDDDYVEFDLKIKDHYGQDKEFSKGFLTIRGCRTSEESTVESNSLDTRLSTVDVIYAVVPRAVEATIAVEVLLGSFYGEITAYTTNVRNSLVLYDSKLAGVVTCEGKGVIQLMRPVISIDLKDTLMISIVSQTSACKYGRGIHFTPRVNFQNEGEVNIGDARIHVKVTWSVMDP